jgi:hypothetical protein
MTDTAIRTTLKARLARCTRVLTTFPRERSGASMIFTALALPVVLGMAGLAFDGAIWYLEKRENQTVADNAALLAIMELHRDPNLDESDLMDLVKADAKRNNFGTGKSRRITINNPPKQGPNAGEPDFVEILIEEDRPLYLTSFMVDGPMTVQARAVGQVVKFGSQCVVALDDSMDAALEVSTSDANIGCGVASNSSSDMAIHIKGNANLTADPAQTYGDILVDNNATLDTNTPPQSLSERVQDPYAERFLDPDFIPGLSGACKGVATPITVSGSATLNPNYNNTNAYCGGLNITGDVFMNPGVYIIDDGDFRVGAKARLRGDNVTIILTAWEPSKKTEGRVDNFIIAGQADVQLSAPSDLADPYAGLLFIVDPEAPTAYGDGTSCEPDSSMQCSRFEGGGNMNLTGAIYAPTRQIRFAGGSEAGVGGAACTVVMGKQVTLAGSTNINNDPEACKDAGVTVVTQTRVRVVE